MAIKYDNCKDCHSRCVHAGKDREFVCINGVSCKITTEKPQTNADRIRAMSDEELAELLVIEKAYGVTHEVYYECPCGEQFDDGEYKKALEYTIAWLKQPEEE